VLLDGRLFGVIFFTIEREGRLIKKSYAKNIQGIPDKQSQTFEVTSLRLAFYFDGKNTVINLFSVKG
jgi:hypothetical protein